MSISRQFINLRDRVAQGIANRSFPLMEKYLGLHVTPAHYYSPIPEVSKLNPEVFRKVYDCTGLDWNLVIPKVKSGAPVHWHDIVIPTNYWEDLVKNGNMFWNESYMVHACMLYNSAFRVLWAAYMHLTHAEEMATRFPYLRPEHRLMSFWIQRN